MKLNNSLKWRVNALLIAGLAASSVLSAQARADDHDCCKAVAVASADGTAGADAKIVVEKGADGKAGSPGKSVVSTTVNGRTVQISSIGSVSIHSSNQDVTFRIGSDEFLVQPTALRFNNAEIVGLAPDAKLIEVVFSQNVLAVTVDGQQKYRKALDAPK